MEETKYYTPQIEEFHVGFELEIKLHELKNWEKHTWLPGDQASSVVKYLDQIRVKYLSKECIESFGFELIKEYSDETILQKQIEVYSFWEIGLQEDGFTSIELWHQNRLCAKIQPKETWEHSIRFLGKIKNKSALKIILQQLEII